MGLIDLREETAQDFRIGKEGNGGDDAKSPVEGASERVARLSEAVANAIRLPWGCRARLFAGRLILAQWKVSCTRRAVQSFQAFFSLVFFFSRCKLFVQPTCGVENVTAPVLKKMG